MKLVFRADGDYDFTCDTSCQAYSSLPKPLLSIHSSAFVTLVSPSGDENGGAEGGGQLFHYLFVVLNDELDQ